MFLYASSKYFKKTSRYYLRFHISIIRGFAYKIKKFLEIAQSNLIRNELC